MNQTCNRCGAELAVYTTVDGSFLRPIDIEQCIQFQQRNVVSLDDIGWMIAGFCTEVESQSESKTSS